MSRQVVTATSRRITFVFFGLEQTARSSLLVSRGVNVEGIHFQSGGQVPQAGLTGGQRILAVCPSPAKTGHEKSRGRLFTTRQVGLVHTAVFGWNLGKPSPSGTGEKTVYEDLAIGSKEGRDRALFAGVQEMISIAEGGRGVGSGVAQNF